VFGAPLWLYALATLAIPLALHFWSRRPRDVIQVGSLKHVTDVAESRSWSARLTEPLLLLLRVGVLASVVLGLASPRIANRRFSARVGQLVLVEPALLRDSASIAADPLLDSLAQSRATVRLLAWGFPKLQLDGTGGPHSSAGLPETGDGGRGTVWDLLVAADRLVAPGGDMLVIARPRIATLGGRRPRLQARVRWHLPPPGGTTSWVVSSWSAPGDTVLTLSGRGDPARVRYELAAHPGGSGECGRCGKVKPVAVTVQSDDSVSRRRLELAALAVGSILGQRVDLSKSGESTDLILTTSPVNDALLRLPEPVVSLSPALARSSLLADSVLAYWPHQPLARDSADPREATLSQALPGTRSGLGPEPRDARIPLLLLALLLFATERWLATRPARRPA
jgi:hypothetical protein